MKKGDQVFVYGTLRRGERADLSRHCDKFGAAFIGTDRVNGKLYHLGAYPGAKLIPGLSGWDGKAPTIEGEIFIIKRPALIAIMDTYECYNADAPLTGLYNRKQVHSEKSGTVWIYEYNHPVTEDQRIQHGDWCRAPSQIQRLRMIG